MKQSKSITLILCLLFVLFPIALADSNGGDVRLLTSPMYAGGVQYAEIDDYSIYYIYGNSGDPALVCERQGEAPVTVAQAAWEEFVLANGQVLYMDTGNDAGTWKLYTPGEADAVTILSGHHVFAIGADKEKLWFKDTSDDDYEMLMAVDYDGLNRQEYGRMKDDAEGLLPDGRAYCVEDDQIWAYKDGHAESIYKARGHDDEIDEVYVLGNELWIAGDESLYLLADGTPGFKLSAGDIELFVSTGEQAVVAVEEHDELTIYMINAKLGAYCELGKMKEDDADCVELRQGSVTLFASRSERRGGAERKQVFQIPENKEWKFYR